MKMFRRCSVMAVRMVNRRNRQTQKDKHQDQIQLRTRYSYRPGTVVHTLILRTILEYIANFRPTRATL